MAVLAQNLLHPTFPRMGFLRKIRGVIGNGLVWAGAWITGKLALLVVPILFSGFNLPWSLIPIVLGSAAVTGFINGVLFSVVSAVINRRQTLGEIRPFRTGLLGLAAGATLPVAQTAVAASLGFAVPASAILLGLVLGGGLGAATAVGSLRLAQSAERGALDQPRRDPLAIGVDGNLSRSSPTPGKGEA